jgi:hypothetical protein
VRFEIQPDKKGAKAGRFWFCYGNPQSFLHYASYPSMTAAYWVRGKPPAGQKETTISLSQG